MSSRTTCLAPAPRWTRSVQATMNETDRLIQVFRDRAASPVASKLDALIKLERSSEPGIVPFLVQILADQRDSEEVRIHVLKRLRNGRLAEFTDIDGVPSTLGRL